MSKQTQLQTYLLIVTAVLWFVSPAVAQRIQFAAQTAPYYVGEPVVVQVVVSGVKQGTKLSCRLRDPVPDGLSIEGPRVDQASRSMSMIIINGKQVGGSDSTDYRFSFFVTAAREDTFDVGPFLLEFAGKSRTVEGKAFRFGRLKNDTDMLIDFAIPQANVYVGQRVPLTIKWGFAGDLESTEFAFARLQIRSPLFAQVQFVEQTKRSDNSLVIDTGKGRMRVNAELTREQHGGRQYLVLTGRRAFIPDAPGTFDSIPITCRTKKGSGWGRDIWGDLRPSSEMLAVSAGKAISFEVKPIPLAGRPQSYSGAVGNGFSIDVAANRSVVRVGDPISLSVSLRGDGNLESVSLPDLSAGAGLSDELFHLPSNQIAGTFNGTTKQFKVNVSVKDQTVKQIPAIAFSWFDPMQEQYRSAFSKPIALQVNGTNMVTAADVFSSAKRNGDQEGIAKASKDDLSGENESTSASGLSFVGANLAIERNLDRLAVNGTSPFLLRRVALALYGLSLAVIAGGVILRRRSQMDTELNRKKKRLKSLKRQISNAEQMPPREAAEVIARVLRELLAEFKVSNRPEIENTIAECENRIYALDDQDSSELTSVFEQARFFIDNQQGCDV